MNNKGLILATILMMVMIFSGCGHKQMVQKNTNHTFDFNDRPDISQLNDGTFVYKDKKYDGVDDMKFGF